MVVFVFNISKKSIISFKSLNVFTSDKLLHLISNSLQYLLYKSIYFFISSFDIPSL